MLQRVLGSTRSILTFLGTSWRRSQVLALGFAFGFSDTLADLTLCTMHGANGPIAVYAVAASEIASSAIDVDAGMAGAAGCRSCFFGRRDTETQRDTYTYTHTAYTQTTRPRLARKHNIASEVGPTLQDAFSFSCKLLPASGSLQVAQCKLLPASCSVQAALCKFLCASCSA